MYCVCTREEKGKKEWRVREKERREKGRGDGCLTIPAVCEAVDAVSVSL